MLKILKKLYKNTAVSSKEENLKREIVNMLPDDCEFYEDYLGNLIVKKNANSKTNKKIIFTANLDENGLMVTKITEDGSVLFSTVGNIKTHSLIGCHVNLNNKINGIIGSKPIHLQNKKEKKIKVEDLHIDIGCNSKREAEKIVRVGDIFSFNNNFSEISKDCFSANSLGDRVCCFVLIKLLQQTSNLSLTCVFIVKEKAILNSSKTAAYSTNPTTAIILKPVFTCNFCNIDLHNNVLCLIRDKGAIYDEQLIKTAETIAQKNNIPFDKIVLDKIVPTAKNIATSQTGVKTLTLALCCKKFGEINVVNLENINNFLNLTIKLAEKLCN